MAWRTSDPTHICTSWPVDTRSGDWAFVHHCRGIERTPVPCLQLECLNCRSMVGASRAKWACCACTILGTQVAEVAPKARALSSAARTEMTGRRAIRTCSTRHVAHFGLPLPQWTCCHTDIMGARRHQQQWMPRSLVFDHIISHARSSSRRPPLVLRASIPRRTHTTRSHRWVQASVGTQPSPRQSG